MPTNLQPKPVYQNESSSHHQVDRCVEIAIASTLNHNCTANDRRCRYHRGYWVEIEPTVQPFFIVDVVCFLGRDWVGDRISNRQPDRVEFDRQRHGTQCPSI